MRFFKLSFHHAVFPHLLCNPVSPGHTNSTIHPPPPLSQLWVYRSPKVSDPTPPFPLLFSREKSSLGALFPSTPLTLSRHTRRLSWKFSPFDSNGSSQNSRFSFCLWHMMFFATWLVKNFARFACQNRFFSFFAPQFKFQKRFFFWNYFAFAANEDISFSLFDSQIANPPPVAIPQIPRARKEERSLIHFPDKRRRVTFVV